MSKASQSATQLSLIVLGTELCLGQYSFGWRHARSVFGAIFCAVLVWVAVYATVRRSNSKGL